MFTRLATAPSGEGEPGADHDRADDDHLDVTVGEGAGRLRFAVATPNAVGAPPE
jgi:hypothetical protein